MKIDKRFLAFFLLLAIPFLGSCGRRGAEKAPTAVVIQPSERKVTGGQAFFIRYTLTNGFGIDMEDITITMTEVPAGYPVEPLKSEVEYLKSGYSQPVTFTISTPSVETKETLSPKIKVCFRADLPFSFIIPIISSDNPPETIPEVELRTPNAPLTLDLDLQVTSGTAMSFPGTLTIHNTKYNDGKIIEVESIELEMPKVYGIESIEVSLPFVGCTGVSISDDKVSTKLSSAECEHMKMPKLPETDITFTLKLKMASLQDIYEQTGESVVQVRGNGTIKFYYCYFINVGTLTVCPLGKPC